MTEIREFTSTDWPEVWSILEPVFRAGETYPQPVDIPEAEARAGWIDTPVATFVAVDSSGSIVGTYYLKPNLPGQGSHVANCGYAVAEGARGKGVATRMCLHSQRAAAGRGFRALQFNLVVSTNHVAVHLWQKCGMRIVGTLPGAFASPTHGDVDAYVMYRELDAGMAEWQGDANQASDDESGADMQEDR